MSANISLLGAGSESFGGVNAMMRAAGWENKTLASASDLSRPALSILDSARAGRVKDLRYP